MGVREENILNTCLGKLESILQDAGYELGSREGVVEQGFDYSYHLPALGLSLMIEVKHSLQPYLVDKVVYQARHLMHEGGGGQNERLVVFASRIPRSALDKCVELDISVLDEEGNGFLRLPGLYYNRYVPSKRGSGSAGAGQNSIFSAKASRLAQAMLVHYPEQWSQAQLAEKAKVTPGYVSKIISKMIDADYIRRDKDKLRVVDPNRLLDSWGAAYRFDRHRRLRFAMGMGVYLQGVRKLQQDMLGQDIKFAFTGWSAAYLRSPYGMPDSIVAYVDRLTEDIPFRSIHPVASKGNVLLLLPHDEGVFQFAQPSEFGDCVSDVQCYLDLLGSPGRASDQAEALREKRLAF